MLYVALVINVVIDIIQVVLYRLYYTRCIIQVVLYRLHNILLLIIFSGVQVLRVAHVISVVVIAVVVVVIC